MNYDPQTYIVMASHNKGKIREFSELLKDFELKVLSLSDFPEIPEVEETGTTFMENALLKAQSISKLTGLVAMADDSGLEVDALGGEPGVYSARYSREKDEPATDEKNTAKVLKKLENIPDNERSARFLCSMVASMPDGENIQSEGSWEGFINRKAAGENGFGYDPIFFDPEAHKTAAQLSSDEKNSKSHRGKALKLLLQEWPDFWEKWLAK